MEERYGYFIAHLHAFITRLRQLDARRARGGDPSKILLQRAGDGWKHVAGDPVTLPE
jgi:hypothetical protein